MVSLVCVVSKISATIPSTVYPAGGEMGLNGKLKPPKGCGKKFDTWEDVDGPLYYFFNDKFEDSGHLGTCGEKTDCCNIGKLFCLPCLKKAGWVW